jgi:hypothetical protein
MLRPSGLALLSILLILLIPANVSGQLPTIGGCPVLPADHIWNTPVDQLPVSANWSVWVATIGSTKTAHPDFGSGRYDGAPMGIPFITVPTSQSKYPVSFQYADESDPGPYAIPLTAPIEGGSQSSGDRHVIAIDTGNCILYELYATYPQASSWTAGSGAIFNLPSNALRPSGWTSTDAAGLPIFPGLIRYDEVAAGAINHAIRFTVPQTQKAFVWPARHYASSLTGSQYPPMGARFRLRASFDISGFSPANQVILKALKKYGMMLADNGSAWYLSGATDSRWNNDDLHNLSQLQGSDFEAVDVSGLRVDVNSGQARQANTVTVSVTPASARVPVNGMQQFTATATNATTKLVNWEVNGAPGGNSTVGWISTSGLYTAPAAIPAAAVVVAGRKRGVALGGGERGGHRNHAGAGADLDCAWLRNSGRKCSGDSDRIEFSNRRDDCGQRIRDRRARRQRQELDPDSGDVGDCGECGHRCPYCHGGDERGDQRSGDVHGKRFGYTEAYSDLGHTRHGRARQQRERDARGHEFRQSGDGCDS